jgi:hypothetical protein
MPEQSPRRLCSQCPVSSYSSFAGAEFDIGLWHGRLRQVRATRAIMAGITKCLMVSMAASS